MRVVFFNPSRAGQGNIPLNIPLLIGIIKRAGHEVRLFDFSDYACFDNARQSYESVFFKEAQFNAGKLAQERDEFYRKNSTRPPAGLSLKTTDYRKDFVRLLADFHPDVIAVSCLSVDFKFASEFLSSLRKEYKVPVIFGGIQATLLPEETLGSDAVDYVCVGEGEKSLLNFLEALSIKGPLEGARGIWFKKGAKIIKNPAEPLADLSTLPLPDYEYFDPLHFYRPFDGRRYKMLNYELSRGCVFNCTYCVNGVLKEKYRTLGAYHRTKEIGQSIAELIALIKKYNFDFIRFWDEDFTTTGEDYLADYAARYKKEIGLPFLIYARADTVTEKKVRILKEMGCATFAMGIESGNEFIRKKVMARNITNDAIVEKFNLVKSYGIRVSAYNIIGLPFETRENIFDTIALNKTVNPNSFSVTLLEPYKGTPIRAMCEEEGLSADHETVYNAPQFIPRGMTREEIAGLFRVFPLYVRFGEERYLEIERAESDDGIYKKLLQEFNAMK